MFRTWNQSWELVKASWGILQKNRQLLAFPFLSLIGAVIITGIFGAGLLVYGVTTGSFNQLSQDPSTTTPAQRAIGIVVLFLYYLAMAIVTIYTNAALTSAVFRGLAGQSATVGDGFAAANARLGKIVGFAAITATVGVLLSLVRNAGSREGNGIGAIITSLVAGLVGLAWNIATFLVIPVLVAENIGPIESIKRSAGMLQQTWGRQIVGNFSIGGIFGLLTLGIGVVIGLPTYALFSATHSFIILVAGIALFAVVAVLLSLIQGAMNSIFRASLYRFASSGQVVYYPQGVLQGAFTARPSGAFGR
ncbi:MAG: hypothetical protein H0X24_15995 [Ktedonobacterales bacterium]|nr:hypothetical protein [Ktedonobacterales bacterium]